MMQLHDALIMRVRELLTGFSPEIHSFDAAKAWPETKDFEMIFQKDAAFELGGGNKASVNLTCVTDNVELFMEGQDLVPGRDFRGVRDFAEALDFRDAHALPNHEICVYGRDLQEIQGDVSYARICEVLVKGEAQRAENAENPKQAGNPADAENPKQASDPADAERTLKLLQDVDFVKFHVYGKGFMMRTSGQSAREPVRVAKKALQDGITFERMGDAFISHYQKNPEVLAVRVSFITEDAFDYNGLAKEAQKAVEIRNSLSKIQKGLPTECSVCDVREICNEVTGLRELHFGKKERREKDPAG